MNACNLEIALQSLVIGNGSLLLDLIWVLQKHYTLLDVHDMVALERKELLMIGWCGQRLSMNIY